MSNRTPRFLFNAILVAALLLATAAPAFADPGENTDEILVKFLPGTPGQAVAEAHRQNGGQLSGIIEGIDVHVVKVPAGSQQARVAAYLRNPNVLYAEVNGTYSVVGTFTPPPNDTYYGTQWQYNNTGQNGGTADADLDAPEAWVVTTGSGAVNIAILDTGIDQSHPDLKAKILKVKNFSSSRSSDDKYGHGTHVAGSAAAITNNSAGVAGTCPDCRLFNVKVLGDNGSGSFSGIAAGIIWAADNGANVINMSLGGTTGSNTLRDAVDYAWGKGVVVVAAAGNSSTDSLFYPASYTNVIAVAATDRNDAMASFSNFGASWVDVAAPGLDIFSTAPDHSNRIWGKGKSYGTISGTSMASPHVAGIAGLVWSTGACTTATCVRAAVEHGADAIAGTGTDWAWGRVNAYKAVTIAP